MRQGVVVVTVGGDAQKGRYLNCGWFGSALFLTDMIEVDDSLLEDLYREFLTRWAEALQVPLAVLVLRIVEASIDDEQYTKGKPVNSPTSC